ARHPARVPHRARGVLSVPAGSRHPRATVGAARDAGTRAPHRRYREAGRDGEHLLRSGESRPHGPHPRREGAAGGPGDPAAVDKRAPHPTGGGGSPAAVEEARAEGKAVASLHLLYLNPLPPDLGHILRQYRRVLIPEINSGQLVRILRAEYLVDAGGFNRVRALPLASQEIYEAINQLLEAKR